MNINLRVIKLAMVVAVPLVAWPQSDENGSPFLPRELFEIAPVRSFLVRQGEEMLVEEYGDRMHADRTTNIKSASKAIVSLLIGIAIEKGFVEGVDQPIGGFFPDYFAVNPDAIKEAITIEDLLTMRAGLESTSRRNYGRWVLSDNWSEFALGQPFTEEPGGRMIYSTGSSHLLSVILTKASGMTTRSFAERYLFDPLDITVGGWGSRPTGVLHGGEQPRFVSIRIDEGWSFGHESR